MGSELVVHWDSREVEGLQLPPDLKSRLLHRDLVPELPLESLDGLDLARQVLGEKDHSSVELVPGNTLATVAHAHVPPPGLGVHGLLVGDVREPDVDSHEQVQLHLALVLLPRLVEELPAARLLNSGLDDTLESIISELRHTTVDLTKICYGTFHLGVVAWETFDSPSLKDSTSFAVQEGHVNAATCFPDGLFGGFSARESSGGGLVLLPKENRAALFFPHYLWGIAPPVGGSKRNVSGGGDRSNVVGERRGHEARGGVVLEEVQGAVNNYDSVVLDQGKLPPPEGGIRLEWPLPLDRDFFWPRLETRLEGTRGRSASGRSASGGLLPLREEWIP